MPNCKVLKPDRQLLNPKFESYKLSLDPLPIYEKKLDNEILHVQPDEKQYSLQDVKIFNLHNHLLLDPWHPSNLYYVDSEKAVNKTRFEEHLRFEEVKKVFQIPQQSSQMHYNTSLSFPSAHLALLGDGYGTLYLIETGDRLSDAEWKICFSSSSDDINLPFVILHSMSQSEKEMSCLLLSVEEKSSCKYSVDAAGPFIILLTWIDFVSDEFHDWSVYRTRKLAGAGCLEYASLSPQNVIMHLASKRPFTFVYDSLQPIDQSNKEEKDTTQEFPPVYTWMQNQDELTVVFKVPKEIKKEDITINFLTSSLEVLIPKHSIALKGRLFNKVDTEQSTWTLEGEKLELTLYKANATLIWHELIVGDDRGKEIMDPALLDEVHQRLEHLTSENCQVIDNKPAFNTQQLEECDMYPTDDSLALYTIDGNSHRVVNQDNMSGNQWLFNTMLLPDLPLAFCTRHDVDGLVWQPTGNGEFQHKITFNAFGYVQASKQDRKFSGCSPDGSYAVISDTRKHLYIYHQPSPLKSSVRNRRTGEEINTLAQQQVVSLETTDDVLGMQITNENVFVLTRNFLYAVRSKIN